MKKLIFYTIKILKNYFKLFLIYFPVTTILARFFTRGIDRIFLYHHFTNNEYLVGSLVSSSTFEWQVKQAKKYYHCLTLTQAMASKNLTNVVFTIDDGYLDFYRIAFPILIKNRISATFYVTTSFIDRSIWLWPDRLMYCCKNTLKKRLYLKSGNILFDIDMSFDDSFFYIFNKLRILENDHRMKLVNDIEAYLGVTIPKSPPVEYAACSWNQLIEMSNYGIEIGSHTMTHPILSRLSKSAYFDEILKSKMIIENRLNLTVTCFCYPNGGDIDVNDDVINYVKSAGYKFANQGNYPWNGDLFRIPRLGVTNDRTDFLWKLHGFEILTRKIFKKNSKGISLDSKII